MPQMNEEQLQEILRLLAQQQQHQHIERVQAARRGAERQQAIDETPQRKYAIIVAVDDQGGFSKDEKIPWDFPQDLKWFKDRTEGHICVMGRKTYENINSRLDDKMATSVLPNRRCFVLSNTVQEYPNATIIKGILEIENHLADEDADKTIFIIGGERLYKEGLSLVDTVYVTALNSDYSCDKFFPVDYLLEHFYTDKVYKREDAPELRFTTWKRRR